MAGRREFPEPVKRAIRERSGGRCECARMPADIRHMFPRDCDRQASEIDHIRAEVLVDDKFAPLTAEDGAHLSSACHLIKTASDQACRKKRNRHRVRDDRPKPGWFQKGRKIQSKGFDKTHTRKMDGTVIRRVK